jgi:hypothetical protein
MAKLANAMADTANTVAAVSVEPAVDTSTVQLECRINGGDWQSAKSVDVRVKDTLEFSLRQAPRPVPVEAVYHVDAEGFQASVRIGDDDEQLSLRTRRLTHEDLVIGILTMD